LAVFALGFFTHFEILDVVQRTRLFSNRKQQIKFGFFRRKCFTQNMHMSRILTFITNLCSVLTRVCTIKVTNFHPPVKTLVPNSWLKL